MKSLRRWLSRWLAIQTFLALGVVCVITYVSVHIKLSSHQETLLEQKRQVVVHLMDEYIGRGDHGGAGDHGSMDHKLRDFFFSATDFSLSLAVDGVTTVYGNFDPASSAGNLRQSTFSLQIPDSPATRIRATLFLDTTPDARLLTMLGWTLFLCALGGAIAVSIIGDVLVVKALAPLRDVGKQAERLSAASLADRLDERGLAEELRPMVGQFNALLQRLERAYVQMEGFNADVAHELRTPLATLIGDTELALSARNSAVDLRDLLGSNLEELQRMSSIVNDMLFLSNADRGARARAVRVPSLKTLVDEVLEYHEAEALEKNLGLSSSGDSAGCVDVSLFKRAVSNLISNAVRYGQPGSDITTTMEQTHDGKVRIGVRNAGEPIAPEHIPRIFYRFYRTDSARVSESHHHGLGLAIVAAIAHMHGGDTFAVSRDGFTVVGFTVPSLDGDQPEGWPGR